MVMLIPIALAISSDGESTCSHSPAKARAAFSSCRTAATRKPLSALAWVPSKSTLRTSQDLPNAIAFLFLVRLSDQGQMFNCIPARNMQRKRLYLLTNTIFPPGDFCSSLLVSDVIIGQPVTIPPMSCQLVLFLRKKPK